MDALVYALYGLTPEEYESWWVRQNERSRSRQRLECVRFIAAFPPRVPESGAQARAVQTLREL